ncbi:alpha/beta fold hydrolase [Woodsholea maritima]|uniref:alpha/beta fold hydrolase n=1 Tax=Woodsholea maritima TaxID=240237 RepID=UPI00037CD1F8|nr:alpha/beta hydrolase [Woodsholea maritima]
MLKRILGGAILITVAIVAYFAWTQMGDSAQPGQTPSDDPYFTANDRYVEAAGARWRVRETGPETGETLVLIHGFTHSLEAFEAWADRLDETYRVIRFDLPAHGLTGPREDNAYSIPQTVDQVAALLDEITEGPFILAGNSLGGLVAWRYAKDHEDQVKALILISPGGYSINGVTETPVEVPDALKAFFRFAPEIAIRAATSALYADPSKVTDAQVRRITDLMKRDGNGEAMIARLEQFTLPDPQADLGEVEVPTLLIWGDHDTLVPTEHGPRFEAAMPNARLVIIENAGHVAMEEAPEESLAPALEFLNGLNN